MEFSLRNLPAYIVWTVLFVALSTKCDDTDGFKMENFQNVTAIYSSSPTYDGDNLECLTAEMTQFDPQAGTAEYTWYLKNNGGGITKKIEKISPGDTPDEVRVVSSTHPGTVWIARFPFTDNKTCYIMKSQHIENMCILWTRNDFADNVSQQCLEANKKICGQGVLLYDKEKCGRYSSHS